MEELDSIKLLKECDSGTKMGIESFELVLKYIKGEELRKIIDTARLDHIDILREINELLDLYSSEGKDPNMFISEMSKMKTKIELTFDDSDSKIASIMFDGCNMGIKSLSEFKNKYKLANNKVVEICKKIIYKEEILAVNLRKFL